MNQADGPVGLSGALFIAGEERLTDLRNIVAWDPEARCELEPAFSAATADDVDDACVAAAAAFATFRSTDGTTRAALLERIAELLEENADAIVERATLETGLPNARTRGELGRTTGQLRMFADLARSGGWVDARLDTPDPDRAPLPKPDLRSMLMPMGPVVVFGASNFPLAFSVAGGDTASALAAGNPVIVKAHGSHPGTSELVGRAILQAVADLSLPPGTFSMLHGPGRDVGIGLVKHAAVAAVGFTGSRTGGMALSRAAAERDTPIPVFAEMSSQNPVFILPAALSARPVKIAEALAGSVTLGVGQFCTKPGLVLGVQGEAWETFKTALTGAMTATAPGVMLNRGVALGFDDARGSVVSLDEVDTLTGDGHLAADGPVSPSVHATTFASFLGNDDMQSEMFGPAVLLVECSSTDQLMVIAEALEGQLTVSVHLEDSDAAIASALLPQLERLAGRIVFNGFPTGVEVGTAMVHGGPFPASTDSRFTSVGTAAVMRFVRPVCYQNVPDSLLPESLKDGNPLGIPRLVDGVLEP